MLGRPWLYGLAAGGQAGVEQSIDILAREIDLTMGLLGIKSLEELTPQCLSFE
jgi:isopentenyl diphosphate isomerase/L-lactate dehydrogenase-like FMN-dependent dehydrogenase